MASPFDFYSGMGGSASGLVEASAGNIGEAPTSSSINFMPMLILAALAYAVYKVLR